MQSRARANFLQELEKEAQLQFQLEQQKILPYKLQGLARLVAAYPWQVLVVLSLISAVVGIWFF